MSVKHNLRLIINKLGYDISKGARVPLSLARRKLILQHYQIDTVLDVGANTGQFATGLRSDIGYTGRILSFEPVGAAFSTSKERASGDKAWDVFNYALGERNETMEINIAGNSYSSSFLGMLPSHLKLDPKSRYVGKERVEIKTLDSIYEDLCKNSRNVYLKIDTQGFEIKVLRGATQSLDRIDTIQMEMSLVPLYENELLFHEMYRFMGERGYSLIGLEDGASGDEPGEVTQVDGIFHRFRR